MCLSYDMNKWSLCRCHPVGFDLYTHPGGFLIHCEYSIKRQRQRLRLPTILMTMYVVSVGMWQFCNYLADYKLKCQPRREVIQSQVIKTKRRSLVSVEYHRALYSPCRWIGMNKSLKPGQQLTVTMLTCWCSAGKCWPPFQFSMLGG